VASICRLYGGVSDEQLRDLESDGSTLWAGGSFSGSFPVGDGLDPMGSTDGFILRLDLDGDVDDARQMGSTGDASVITLVPYAGDVVAGGTYQGTLFGREAVAGNLDLWISDLGSGKNYANGGVGFDAMLDIATDGTRVAITGDAQPSVDLGDGPLLSGGYVGLWDPVLWDALASLPLGAGSAAGTGNSLAFDVDGSIHALVALGGPGSTDLACNRMPLMTASDNQVALMKLGGAAKCDFARLLPTALDQDPILAIRGGNQPVMAGYFQGAGDLDGHPFQSMGENDVMIAFFDAVGTATAVITSSGTGDEQVGAIAVGPTGLVYVAGTFTGEIRLGDFVATSTDEDMFLAKVTAAGDVVWAMAFGGQDVQRPTAMTFDPEGNLWVGGFTRVSIPCAEPAPVAAGSFDMFLMRFDAAGL